MFATNSEHGRNYFANSSKQTTNLASINLTQLRSFPVPLPPLAEQARLIEEVESKLSLAQAAEQIVDANLTRVETLRQGMLEKAFEGKLVPQDPHNDEPASALLESIREERKRRKEEGKSAKVPRYRKPIMKSESKPTTFQEILKEVPSMTADELFKQAGFVHDQVEAFYEQLRLEISKGRIRIVRTNEVDVFLEMVSE